MHVKSSWLSAFQLSTFGEHEWREMESTHVCCVSCNIEQESEREWMNEKSLIFPDPIHPNLWWNNIQKTFCFVLFNSLWWHEHWYWAESVGGCCCWSSRLNFVFFVLWFFFHVFVFRSENWWMPSQCLLCSSWVLCNMKKKLSDLNLDYIPFFCYFSPHHRGGETDDRRQKTPTDSLTTNCKTH